MGKLTNLNPVTEASLPPEMTRDTELLAALTKVLSLFPRSSVTGAVNGDNCLTSSAAGFMWLDGDIVHSNVPANTGSLFQIDPLWGTAAEKLYRIQIMVPRGLSASNTSLLFLRHQNNGIWTAWRSI
jgi:hypothetical protein